MCILKGGRNYAFMTDVLYKNNCLINLTVPAPPHYEGQINGFMYFWVAEHLLKVLLIHFLEIQNLKEIQKFKWNRHTVIK